jgi:hypothetical protein
VSANLTRRNLSKGQQAMALAMIYPEAAKMKRKGAGSLETEELKFSSGRLSQARTILRHSAALADDVGKTPTVFRPKPARSSGYL